MAGIDFFVMYRRDLDKPFLKDLLRLLQSVARQGSLEFRYRGRTSAFYCTLDGSLPDMQRLREMFPSRVWGFVAAKHDLPYTQRKRLGMNLLGQLFDAIDDAEQSVTEAATALGGTALTFRFSTDDPNLSALVRDLSQDLISWYTGAVSRRHMVETWHSAFENVLRYLVRDQESPFKALVNHPRFAGTLSQAEKAALEKLNEIRRNVKHRGQGVKIQWLYENTYTLCLAFDKLLRKSNGLPIDSHITMR